MQIQNKKRSKRVKPAHSNFIDNDFASGFEDSRFEKFKPVIKALIVVILLVGVIWGAVVYFGGTNEKNNADNTYTPTSADSHKTPQGATEEADSEISDSSSQDSSVTPADTSKPTSGSSSGNSTSTTKPYDPSKCEPLNNEATRLRQIADQRKIALDVHMDEVSKVSYGDIFDEAMKKYGSPAVAKIEADRISKERKDKGDQLLADWQDALSKGNAAYSKYQECRASL